MVKYQTASRLAIGCKAGVEPVAMTTRSGADLNVIADRDRIRIE